MHDPRRRNLAILAAIAAVLVLLAVLALWQRARESEPRYVEEAFFPKLAQHVRQIADIRISSRAGTFDVAFKPDAGWVLPQHDNYPASFERLRQTVVGMAALQTIEPKTSRPDWLPLVDLGAPPKGDGVEISLLDEKGHAIAAMIAGKTVDIGDASGAQGLFARKPNSDQAWLLRSVFQPKASPAQWLDKTVMDVDRARIREVDVDPVGSPSFTVVRAKPGDADFAIASLPAGRQMAFAGAADAVGAAITEFSFDDVKPAHDFDFSDSSKTARLVTKTFDGLTVTTEVQQQGKDDWATVSADSAPGNAEAAKEAREINGHASGWAYKLPQFKGQLFMTTLESLLKPKSGPTAK
ncbi:MAG: DUF4340 domain-containing protein [Rhizomicrobium sp.]